MKNSHLYLLSDGYPNALLFDGFSSGPFVDESEGWALKFAFQGSIFIGWTDQWSRQVWFRLEVAPTALLVLDDSSVSNHFEVSTFLAKQNIFQQDLLKFVANFFWVSKNTISADSPWESDASVGGVFEDIVTLKMCNLRQLEFTRTSDKKRI